MRRALKSLVPLAFGFLAACPNFDTGNPDARFACNAGSGEDCGDAGHDGGLASDAGAGVDAGGTDAGSKPDAGAADGGSRDSGAGDAGTTTDAGATDAGGWHVEYTLTFSARGISGEPTRGIYVVGQNAYAASPSITAPSWTTSSPAPDFTAVWVGNGPNGLSPYAVATDGNLYWYTGSTWMNQAGLSGSPLVTLWGDSTGANLYAASASTVFRYSGVGNQGSTNRPTGLSDVTSLWADDAGALWVAGQPASGSARTYVTNQFMATTTWTAQSDGSDGVGQIFAVWGDQASPANVVTAGEAGSPPAAQVFWNLASRATDAAGPLHAITGWYDNDNYWAGGEKGAIVQWDHNANWTSQPTPTQDTITGMWTPDGVNVWAVTDGGLILRYP